MSIKIVRKVPKLSSPVKTPKIFVFESRRFRKYKGIAITNKYVRTYQLWYKLPKDPHLYGEPKWRTYCEGWTGKCYLTKEMALKKAQQWLDIRYARYDKKQKMTLLVLV